jgi:secernin
MKTLIKIILILVVIIVIAFNLVAAALACDTWVALGNVTARGLTLFAKNSDRPLFDAQPLVLNPRARWLEGASVDLGRVRIPQVRVTYATLGSSPYWCWGYEEGVNEFGVAIGNEGVKTRPLAAMVAEAAAGRFPAPGPTGMDLLRLGLERGRTAKEALEVITVLVERYGQFGSGLPTAGPDGAYDNSFIIADAREAWVLETAGREWAAKRLVRGTASISNALTLTTGRDLASKDLVGRAVASGWWPRERSGELDFAAAYADDSPAALEAAKRSLARQSCSAGLLAGLAGRVTAEAMMGIARDRSSTPSLDLDQTASSCVAELPGPGGLPVLWWCAATPSRSCYIPVFVHGARLPAILSKAGTAGRAVIAPDKAPRDAFAEDSYWWLFRDLCDKINADEAARLPSVRSEFDALEKAFAAGVPDVAGRAAALRKNGRAEEAAAVLDAYTASCVDKALEKVRELRTRFAAPPAVDVPVEFRSFVGTYAAASGPLAGREFRVLVRNGRLAVDIPGQAVVDLAPPDANGRRPVALNRDVAFSFEGGSAGPSGALNLHQATAFPRLPSPDAVAGPNAPAELAPLLGTYALPAARLEIAVLVREGGLALDIKGQGVVGLTAPDADGMRAFADDPGAKISFVLDASGKVTAMRLHRTFMFPRKTG